MKLILENFRIVDEKKDFPGTVIAENGIITQVISGEIKPEQKEQASVIINGKNLRRENPDELPILMPAFVDLHAHFREPGNSAAETIESACLAAAAGGFGTVVCMANTKPAIDSLEKLIALKERSDALGLIDLYPVMSLTRGMEGKELSSIDRLIPRPDEISASVQWKGPLMLSEDGRDLEDETLFLKAMEEARRLDVPISCHCDFGSSEGAAVRRAIELGKKASCHIHIAHVSTEEALSIIREAKKEAAPFGSEKNSRGFSLTCEAMPHHFCLTRVDAEKMGAESFGRVNPPLQTEEDRRALILAIKDGTADAIATDHAPHTAEDKAKGAPGFSGLETAFAASFTELARGQAGHSPVIDLKRLSFLMSANPARLIGLAGPENSARGRINPGCRADLAIIDTESSWIADPGYFRTRGKNSAFTGRKLFGKILLTFRGGKIIYEV